MNTVQSAKRSSIALAAILCGCLVHATQAGVIEDPPATAFPVTDAAHVVADPAHRGIGPSSTAVDRPLDIALAPGPLDAAGEGARQVTVASEEEILGTLSVPAVLPLLGVGLIALRLFTERRLRRQHLRRRQRMIADQHTN